MFHINTMDINTALVCAAVFVFSAVMVYLISVFGMKERTYEEAIEEQRRRNQEATHHTKSDKNKKDKKFKKWGRKSKEKSGEDDKLLGGIEQEHVLHHQEFKAESEMLEDDSDLEQKTSKPVKKSKALTSKAPIFSRDEAVQPSSSEETDEDQSHADSYTKNTQSDDSGKLSRDKEASNSDQLQNKKDNEANEGQEENTIYKFQDSNRMPVKSIDHLKMNENITLPPFRTSPSKKTKKNVRNENLGGDKTDSSGNKLITALKNASPNDEEIQMMIDILLNKQSGSSEWMKRNDPVAALKKHLQENEQALENEQRLVQAANNKIKEMRQELAQEKSRASANERNLREKVAQQQQEIQNLHNRIQCTHEQHLTERSNLQAKLQQVEQVQGKISEDHNMTVQRLQEEKSQLQQALSRLEADNKRSSLEINRLQREIEQLISTREQYETRQVAMQQAQDDLHRQTQQLEEHIQKLVSNHKEEEFGYKQHLNDISNKLKQAESSKASLAKEIQNIQSVCNSLESETITLQQRLEEAEHLAGTKTHELQQVQNTLEEAHKKHMELAGCCDQLQNEILQMKNKENEQAQQLDVLQKVKEELSAELESTMEKLSQLEKAGIEESLNKVDLSEYERIVQMLSTTKAVFQECSEELNTYKSESVKMKDEIENYKKKNDELREKNWKAMEAVTAAEKEADEKIQESEKKISKIKKEAEEKHQEVKKEADKCQEIQKSLEKANEKITILQNKLKEADKKFEDISREATQKVIEAQRNAEDRVEQILTEAAEKYNELHQDLEERLKEEKATSREEVEMANKIADEREKECKELQECCRNLQTQMEEKIEQAVKSTEMLMVQKQNNLQTKLYELEDIIDHRTKQNEKLLKDSAALLKQEQESKMKILQRLFPDVHIDQQLSHEDWVIQFQEKASNVVNDYKKMISKQEAVVSELNENNQLNGTESKEYVTKLEAQVLHYKTVLSETEDILNQLQNSVETEEQVWVEKLKSKDKELLKITTERDEMSKEKSLIENHLKELCIEETEKKLMELHSQLQNEELEKKQLEQKLEEANNKLIALQDELDNKTEQQTTLSNDIDNESHETMKNELEGMKIQLEDEKKHSMELSSQVIKLNMLVKASEDAIKAEQEQVKELKAQLYINKGSTANGTTVQTGDAPVSTNSRSVPVKSDKPKKSRKRGASNRK